MRTNLVTPISFCAHIPPTLRSDLFNDASKKGRDTVEAFFKQAKHVDSWGSETTSLSVIEDKAGRHLALIDSYMAPFRNVLLPFKKSLIDSFLSLKEKDILKAESSLMR